VEMHGGIFTFLGEVAPDVSITSMTFSGLNGDNDQIYGLRIDWRNGSTGAASLDFLPNGSATPAGSVCVREQFEAVTALREDGTQGTFNVGDLQAVGAGTFLEGAVFFVAQSAGADGPQKHRQLLSEGYAVDTGLLLASKNRFFRRQGFWNDVNTLITSLTLSISGLAIGNAIDVGSDFRLFKVQ